MKEREYVYPKVTEITKPKEKIEPDIFIKDLEPKKDQPLNKAVPE